MGVCKNGGGSPGSVSRGTEWKGDYGILVLKRGVRNDMGCGGMSYKRREGKSNGYKLQPVEREEAREGLHRERTWEQDYSHQKDMFFMLRYRYSFLRVACCVLRVTSFHVRIPLSRLVVIEVSHERWASLCCRMSVGHL